MVHKRTPEHDEFSPMRHALDRLAAQGNGSKPAKRRVGPIKWVTTLTPPEVLEERSHKRAAAKQARHDAPTESAASDFVPTTPSEKIYDYVGSLSQHDAHRKPAARQEYGKRRLAVTGGIAAVALAASIVGYRIHNILDRDNVPPLTVSHTVQPGDRAWTIARALVPQDQVTATADAIMNQPAGVDGVLKPGEQIMVPTDHTP